MATVHLPSGWHPLHIAKDGAVIDHMGGGRWGINVVTGSRQRESRLFGFEQIPHDQRYAMADEFVILMKRLWTEDDNLTINGQWYKTAGAFVAPKPVHGLGLRPPPS